MKCVCGHDFFEHFADSRQCAMSDDGKRCECSVFVAEGSTRQEVAKAYAIARHPTNSENLRISLQYVEVGGDDFPFGK